VSTYPPVTDRECADALARIRARHEKHPDPRWWQAEPDSDEAASSVLAYLRANHARYSRGLAAADVWDELVVSAWLYWQRARAERELLHRARYYGLSLADLGAFLGIHTRQGMQDRLDGLDGLLGEYARIRAEPRGPATGDGHTAAVTRLPRAKRSARGADLHATRQQRAEAKAKPTRENWINQHRLAITTALWDLLEQAARVGIHPEKSEDPAPEDSDEDTDEDTDETPPPAPPGLGDYLAWIVENLTREQISTGLMGLAGLALGELRSRDAVTELPRNHGLAQAMRATDRLRGAYADLTPADSPSPSPGTR
jgi:hypothetical protein